MFLVFIQTQTNVWCGFTEVAAQHIKLKHIVSTIFLPHIYNGKSMTWVYDERCLIIQLYTVKYYKTLV